MNNTDGPMIDPDIQKQIKEFNQSLLDLASHQYKAMQQASIVRQWELSSKQEGQVPRIGERRTPVSALLHSAATGVRHWLIATLTAMEEAADFPLPDGKHVIVIDGTITERTTKERDNPDEPSYTNKHTQPATANGTAPGPDDADRELGSTSDQPGQQTASESGTRLRRNPGHRASED